MSSGRTRSGRMTAEDHHAQDALERLAVARLQRYAEQQNIAISTSADEKLEGVAALLASNGHTWRTLLSRSAKARAYSANLRQALPVFFSDLRAANPGARFDFTATGTSGRIAQIKGDCEITILQPDGQERKVSLSLKNYINGPERIQVGSGTFQSFALSFLLLPAGIGRWRSPIDGSEKSTRSAGFREWRDKHTTAIGGEALAGHLAELDRLNEEMRRTFLSDDTFRFYDKEAVSAIQRSTGAKGAAALKQILDLLGVETVRSRLLRATGLLGDEDLLVFGGGLIADTITDASFAVLVERLRHATMTIEQSGQSLRFVFSAAGEADTCGAEVLTVEVPCTINTNGAWFRDGEPYEGTRYHRKEKRELYWGERRPRKSREIATSINTYLDLSATGVLRPIAGPAESPAERHAERHAESPDREV